MDKIERGQRAEALLRDPLLEETLSALDAHYVQAWREAKTLSAREDAHRLVGLVGRFRSHLTSLATTGELSAREKRALTGRTFGLR